MPIIPETTRREMRRAGFRFGAYDGAYRRRFVLFTEHDAKPDHVNRREFDTRRERDEAALRIWDMLRT